ncbi:efflux RND transporter permease subunit [Shimia sp. MIT1388]|uniref:efflux RND transporter permease subunit n=1 Tax=Shimia sp. MIT1388 TaxID=3096992 RepID=UPI00399B7F77
MSALTRLGLEKERLTALFLVLTLALGVLSYAGFPKREDPTVRTRTVVAIAQHSGLILSQMEAHIAVPMEDAARAVPGVDKVATRVSNGQVTLKIRLSNSIAPNALKSVFDQIREEVRATSPELPHGTIGPIVSTGFGDVAVATIAVSGRGFSHREIADAALALRDRFFQNTSVAAVSLYGVQPEVITLEVSQAKLATVGELLPSIKAALQSQNVHLSGGSVVSGTHRMLVRVTGAVNSMQDIADVLVAVPEYGMVRLGNLLTVRRGYADPPQAPVFQNGDQAVILAVEMAQDVDVTKLGPELQRITDQFAQDMPVGLQIAYSTLQSDIVSATISGAMLNLWQTFLAVLLIMLFCFGWREACTIAAIVPLSISFAFLGMTVLGIELQQVSLAAIIISLGLLVDNGLVVVEDIQRRIRSGQAGVKAACAAGGAFAMPLTVSSVTTVAAFLPLFLLDGNEGTYAFSLGIVVMVMLIGSLLSALYFLPRLAVWTMGSRAQADRKQAAFDRLSAAYAEAVRLTLHAPVLFLLCEFLLVGGSLWQLSRVPNQLFPPSDRPQFLVYMDLPKGTDIAVTQGTALAFSDWLRAENPGVANVSIFVGDGGPRFVLPMDPMEADPAAAFMLVNTVSPADVRPVMRKARDAALARFPNASFRIKQVATAGREPVLDVQISGPDTERLLAAGREVQAMIATAPDVVQNHANWGNKAFEWRVLAAQERLRGHALSTQRLSFELAQFFDGVQVGTLNSGRTPVDVVLCGAGEDRAKDHALRNAALMAQGRVTGLDQISEQVLDPKLSVIHRLNQSRTLTVSANSDQMTTFELLAHVSPSLDQLSADLGASYKITTGGRLSWRQSCGKNSPKACLTRLL